MIDSGHPCWRSFHDNKNEDKSSACQSLGPLSSLEPDFNFDYHWLLTLCYQNGQHYSRRNPLFSNVLLLHKLLITGKGNLVVSRKAELDRDLLKKTCQYRPYSGATVSKVSCTCRCRFLKYNGISLEKSGRSNSEILLRKLLTPPPLAMLVTH